MVPVAVAVVQVLSVLMVQQVLQSKPGTVVLAEHLLYQEQA